MELRGTVRLAAYNNDSFAFGFVVSLSVHAIFLLLVVFGFGPRWEFQQPIIYAVTLGGGPAGGIDDVAKDKPPPVPIVPRKTQADLDAEKAKEAAKEKQKAEEEAELMLKQAEEKKKEEDKKKEEEKRKEEERRKAAEKAKATPKPEPTKAPEKKKTKKDLLAELNKQLEAGINKHTDTVDAGGPARPGGDGTPSDKIGGKNVKPREFFIYRQQLEAYIKKGWHWFDKSQGLLAQVTFDISPEGKISNVRVSNGSGNALFDDSAYRAVLKADPVPPPPPAVYNDFKSVRITFDPRNN